MVLFSTLKPWANTLGLIFIVVIFSVSCLRHLVIPELAYVALAWECILASMAVTVMFLGYSSKHQEATETEQQVQTKAVKPTVQRRTKQSVTTTQCHQRHFHFHPHGSLRHKRKPTLRTMLGTTEFCESADFSGNQAIKVQRCIDHKTGLFFFLSSETVMGPPQLSRMYSEIEILKKLNHENVAKILRGNVEQVREYTRITMAYTVGSQGNLAAFVDEIGELPFPVVRLYTTQILRGLRYIHSFGIIHNAIKASNLMLDTMGTLQISNFTAATHLFTDEMPPVELPWSAPEIRQGKKPSKASDIWSVGCTVHEIFAGVPPQCTHLDSMLLSDKVPREALKFVESMFLEPTCRPNTSELLDDVWLNDKVTFSLFCPSIGSAASTCSSDSSGIRSLLLHSRRFVAASSICTRESGSEIVDVSYSTLLISMRWLSSVREDVPCVEHFLRNAINV